MEKKKNKNLSKCNRI